jgi:hypothetical protein
VFEVMAKRQTRVKRRAGETADVGVGARPLEPVTA